MSKKTLNNSDAAKTWVTWGQQAFESLRAKGLDFEGPISPEITRKIDFMVMTRAYVESNDKPKIQLRYEYPMALFLQKMGPLSSDSFTRSLPLAVEITKLFIPFVDGSALLVQTPSEDTVQCANYIQMLTAHPEIAAFMGADSRRLASLREVVDLVFNCNRVAALNPETLKRYLAREEAVAGLTKTVTVQVNLAPEKISTSQSVDLLLDFFQTPTDTVSMSVTQFITSEFIQKTKS